MKTEKLKKTVEKMIKIARACTGASQVYADMLLSMLPNSTHKVNISYWCYKADRDDFEVILELMQNSHTDILFYYEELVRPHKAELKKIAKEDYV